MIADITIPWFEWWMVPTLITVVLGTIVVWPAKKANPKAGHPSVNLIVGGMEDLMVGIAKCLLIISILISWLIYLAIN